jgi:hypothetical protein
MLNEAVVAPCGTITNPGTWAVAGWLLCNLTVVPPTKAAAPRVTVAVAFAPPVTWVGETAIPARVADAGGFTVSVADCLRLP